MPLDTQLPLQLTQFQAPDVLGMQGQVLQNQAMQQQNQARQMALEEKKAEVEAFKGADFSTPEGRNATLVNIMQRAPQVGMKLMKQFADMEHMQAQSKHYLAQADVDRLKTVQAKQKVIAEAAMPAWNAYQKALGEGKPEPVARAEADRLMPNAIAQVQSSGAFNEDEMAGIPRTFDPNVVGGALMSTGIYSKMIQDRLHESQAKSAESTAALHEEQRLHPEKFHYQRQANTQLFTEPDGTVKSYNPQTQEVKVVSDLKGAKKVGTNSGQGGGTAKVQQRVALVTGAAKNALDRLGEIEKEFGNNYSVSPIFGEHATSPMGKIAEGATRMALTKKQQAFDAQAGSFIDEAIPVFTGGLRGSDSFRRFLAGQLPQPMEDPETRARKWKLFRQNIEGMSNSFATAYGANPQYWGGKTGDSPAVTQADVQKAQQELQEGRKAATGAGAKTKEVDVGGQKMNAQLAPDGKYYVKMPSGKYAEVQE